jgi:hypothetical protein
VIVYRALFVALLFLLFLADMKGAKCRPRWRAVVSLSQVCGAGRPVSCDGWLQTETETHPSKQTKNKRNVFHLQNGDRLSFVRTNVIFKTKQC